MQEMESKLTVLHASKYFDVVGTMHLFSDELAVARAAARNTLRLLRSRCIAEGCTAEIDGRADRYNSEAQL